jgi:hypothetical protein
VDRDTFRLLNTLYYSAQLFVNACERVKEKDKEEEIRVYLPLEWGAGIMVRCLMEIGLGVRHASPDRADWYLEPCIRLANLSKRLPDWYPEATTIPATSLTRLQQGTAACCLLVAEAIVDVLERPDGPSSTERKHAYEILGEQIAKLNLDKNARMQVAVLVDKKTFTPPERLARHDPDLTRLSAIGWTNDADSSVQ